MNLRLTSFGKGIMLLSFLMFFFSCEDNRYLKNLLTSFEKETIALPQRVLKVENGKSGISTIQPEGKTLVIFFAPKECTSCALSHLKQSESILESFDSAPAASVVVLFVPAEEDLQETVQLVSQENISIPVYVDFEGGFLDNKIPEDVRFHSFLLDEDGHPVVVGNPISSERIRDLMLNQI